MSKQAMLEVIEQMEGHIYELEERMKKLGDDDNMDVFWLGEHIKDLKDYILMMEVATADDNHTKRIRND